MRVKYLKKKLLHQVWHIKSCAAADVRLNNTLFEIEIAWCVSMMHRRAHLIFLSPKNSFNVWRNHPRALKMSLTTRICKVRPPPSSWP